ncbi:MAG: efflux RND transporter permease subunit [Spirochaetales bacterium]|nr:efflux RND transporter permease subunit [Spirochaetales bacterium]
MALSDYSLKNRYTIYPLFIAAVIFGILAYKSLPIQLFPDTAPPLVNILTSYPGAAAEDVADLVSDPIEEEVASLEGVVKVSSTSQNGLSLVAVEFRYDKSVDLAAVDTQNAVSRIRSALPAGIAEPQILKFSTSDRPIITLGLMGSDMVAVRDLAEQVLSPEIQRVDGVALVDVFGGYQPELSVHVDRSRLEANNLPLTAVIGAIGSHNVSLPAGEIRSEGQQYSFRVDQLSQSIEEIASIPITTPAGQRILVGDLSRITIGSGEDLSRYRVNGKHAIAMQVFRQDDANTVDVVHRVTGAFDSIREKYPELTVIVADESASFTEQVVANMLGAVGQALALATVIIFLFLGSFRRGLVVAISMPMSFLFTFAGMKLFGIQVDLVTLTAIILAVGMVVDASVVVLENITRHYQDGNAEGAAGVTPFNAALEGAKEIQFSVIAGNVTTLTVLVPLLFLYGFVGKTFGPLAGTMIIAFVSSLLVALMLVPILTMKVTGGEGRMERFAQAAARPWDYLMNRLRSMYVHLLKSSLRRRWVILVAALLLFAAGARILMSLGMELLPKMDGGATFVTVETPSGSSLDETERVVADVEAIILKESELDKLSAQIGFEPGMNSFGGGGVQGPTQGYITITWTPRTEREETIWDIQDRLRDKISQVPGIENFVVRESGSTAKATTASTIVASVKGPDPLILDRLGDEVLKTVASVPGTVNTYRSWRLDQRNVILTVDTNRARELGLPPDEISRELVRSLDGAVAGVYKGEGGNDTPIRVRYAHEYRKERDDAFAVRAFAQRAGTTVPIGTVTKGREVMGQGLVTRENLLPTLDILALHQNRPLNFVSRNVENALNKLQVPEEYTISLEGEEKDMAESRSELAGALGIAFIAVYLLLVAQFKSFAHPITVMMAVPLSLFGIASALWIAGMPVSMPVLVGLILLIGIVVNNSIILIDFIQQRRDAGVDRRTAIESSVDARFRPIMMTSLSTIVGMIPLAMEWALGAERFSPLAVAVIGGMTASTFLTMIVIPVFYSALDDLGEYFKKLRGSR